MPRLAYVNGRYLPHHQAQVSIEDRGYQFSDGVYEFVPIVHGVLLDWDWHAKRLAYSLEQIKASWPVTPRVLAMIAQELVVRNQLRMGSLYLQVTRGVAPRDHAFPDVPTPSSLVITTCVHRPLSAELADAGVGVLTLPDERWQRCDIKSLSLLPNILAKQKAKEAGCAEAWLYDAQGQVTEGATSNAWIITDKGALCSRQLDKRILAGVTRRRLLEIVSSFDLTFSERSFSLQEAGCAQEAFLTSSSRGPQAVTRIDGVAVGSGRRGPFVARLQAAYEDFCQNPGKGSLATVRKEQT